MGMTEDDKRSCCLLEIQETEAKYCRTLEDIEKVRLGLRLGKCQCPSVWGHAGPGLLGVRSQDDTLGQP
jgi:hypothetical protein